MKTSEQNRIETAINKLVKARGWEKFHIPSYLVSSLSVECAELMNCCVWHTPEEINDMFSQKDPSIIDEMADIAINFYSMAKYCNIDIAAIVEDKVDKLLQRYAYLDKGEHR